MDAPAWIRPRLSLPAAQPAEAARGLLARWPRRVAELGLCALVLVPVVLYPLARDQALFAYAGQVILDGGLPYRDVFEQKGPATHYTFALILYLFGEEQWAVRLFFALVLLAGSQLAAALAQRLAGPRARWPAALGFALLVSHGRGAQYFTAQVEDLLLVLSLAALLLVWSPETRRRLGRLTLAAFLLGLACTYKPTAVVPAAALGLLVLWYAWSELPQGQRSFWWWPVRLIACAAALLLPAVLFLGYLAWQGAWEDFWVSVVEHNRTYSGTNRTAWSGALMLLGGAWARTTLVVLLALAAGLVPRSRGFWLLAALGTGHYLAVVWQGKYWPYHWTPVLGVLAVLAAPALEHLGRRIARGLHLQQLRQGWLQFALCGAVTFLVATPHPVQYLDTWSWIYQLARGRISLERYYALYTTGTGDGQEVLEAAEHIRRHSRPGETLLVWGREPMLHFLSGRRAPNRFVLGLSVCRFDSPHILKWRQEYMASLQARPPAFVVVVPGDETHFSPQGMAAQMKFFRRFRRWFRQHYRLDRIVGDYRLYRRRESPRREPPAEKPLELSQRP